MAAEIGTAFVLAAGRGRRMGLPKALLKFEGSLLLQRVARAYLEFGVREVHVILSDEITGALREFPEVKGLVLHAGADPNAPMMESVRRAFRIVQELHCSAFFLQPIDTGPAEASVLRQLQSALADTLVAKPVHDGRGGHPLALSGQALARFNWQTASSLRDCLHHLNENELRRVEVDDASVLRNWNRPEDLSA
jgi:CTP:molybdopterin cytidylyltransferase MocA